MKKINLKSLVRSKFFWQGIIVLLLITSTTFYILKEKEKALRIFTQEQLVGTIEEKKIVEGKLFGTIKAKKIVEETLVAEKEKGLVLEKELEEKKRRIKYTVEKLRKEISARQEAEAQLIMTMKEKRILETKLREFTAAFKTVELEKIVIKPVSTLVGKVLTVNKELAFIVVDLGRANNLKLGDVLSVYRNDKFIGRAEVERVEEDFSAAVILPTWQDVEFKENDEVREI